MERRPYKPPPIEGPVIVFAGGGAAVPMSPRSLSLLVERMGEGELERRLGPALDAAPDWLLELLAIAAGYSQREVRLTGVRSALLRPDLLRALERSDHAN